MTIEQLRQAHGRRPFRPFTLKLGDGTRVRVKHPENLSYSPSGRTVLVVTGEEEWEIVDLLLVTSIQFRNGETTSRGKGGNGR